MGVSIATFIGAPDGIRRNMPQHQIPDTACWTLIDAWLTQPGLIDRRSPVQDDVTTYATASQAMGLAGTPNPLGTWTGFYLASVDADNLGHAVGFKNASSLDQALAFDLATAPAAVFNAKSRIKGGIMVGVASELGSTPTNEMILHYRGASLGVGTARTASPAVAIGDTTITVTAGGTDFTPGAFVFNDAAVLVGVVKSVSSNTITLTEKAIAAASTTVIARPFRRHLPRVSKGRITTATTSATVNGGLTQFRKQGLASGTWFLFKTDYTYIGTVSAVASDEQLTLGSSATVDLLNADYIAIKQVSGTTLTGSEVGWITESHAGHQFFARGNLVHFSDDDDPEAMDLIDDTFTFSEDDVTGMTSTVNALLVHTKRETHQLAGAVGTLPDRWTGDTLLDDGALNPMVCQPYKDGAIWAGNRGIYYWSGGGQPTNIAESLGDDYKHVIDNLSANTRLWSALTRDHYLLYVEEAATQVAFRAYSEESVVGSVQNGVPLNSFCFAINLESGAVSLLTNIGLKGYVKDDVGKEYTVVTAVTSGSASARATVLDLNELWQDDVNNTPDLATDMMVDVKEPAHIADVNPPLWPQFALETKKYDLGNPQILKLIKLFLLHYRLNGQNETAAMIDAETADSLRFATVKGMGSEGQVASKRLYPVSEEDAVGSWGDWQDKRIKFMKRSQFLAMRIWTDGEVDWLQLGAWALGFKQKRPGRV